jgi:septum formation protein
MLILASGSPRRKELLKKITPSFTVIVPDMSMSVRSTVRSTLKISPKKNRAKGLRRPCPLSERRGACLRHHRHLDGEILGKPHTEEEAVQMLLKESGKKQIVLSGYTYISPISEVTRSVSTAVYFNKLTRRRNPRLCQKIPAARQGWRLWDPR